MSIEGMYIVDKIAVLGERGHITVDMTKSISHERGMETDNGDG